jgi:hypothetical protein
VRARPLLVWGAGLAALALVLVTAGYDRADAGTFNPFLEVQLDSTEPETPSNLTAVFGIESKDDVNFGGVVTYIPPDVGIVPGWDIPVGEPVGELSALATLGLINAACNTPIPVDFTFHNASLGPEHHPPPEEDQYGLPLPDLVSFDDLEKEESIRGEDLNGDGVISEASAEGFGTRDFAEDKDGNGLLDAIDRFPDFIPRTLGEEAMDNLFRRSAGITPVAGTPVLLQFLVFDPGTKFDLIGEELDDLIPTDPALGYPTFVLLQAVGDPDIEPEPGPITDFCTPLTSTNITYSTYYDADGDGTPNGLTIKGNPQIQDTCPYDPHPPFGPHDEDFDFLHTECDPDDSIDTGKNEDEDEDGVENFADNCALVANEDQADTDGDFIGDACDENPDEPDGLGLLGVLPQDGTYDFSLFTVGQRDADNDGIMNSLDTCPFEPNLGDPTIPNDGDVDGDGLDAACDPNDDPLAGGANSDQDGDGYLNRQDNCPLVSNGQDQPDENIRNQEDSDIDSIGNAFDPNPDTGDGELIQVTLEGQIVIGTGAGAGGPPSEEACPDCYRGEDPPWLSGEVEETPDDGTDDPPRPNGDDGSNTTLFIIIGAVAAAVVVIGGGALLLLRRGGGA